DFPRFRYTDATRWRGTQEAQGRGLQNLHSWVRIPPAPPAFADEVRDSSTGAGFAFGTVLKLSHSSSCLPALWGAMVSPGRSRKSLVRKISSPPPLRLPLFRGTKGELDATRPAPTPVCGCGHPFRSVREFPAAFGPLRRSPPRKNLPDPPLRADRL